MGIRTQRSFHPLVYPLKVRQISIRLSLDTEVVDNLTGIIDMKKFISIGTEYATRYSGKIVGDQISSYENIHPVIIGQKHFGSFSCLFVSETRNVEFFSNNEKNGNYLHAFTESQAKYLLQR